MHRSNNFLNDVLIVQEVLTKPLARLVLYRAMHSKPLLINELFDV